MNTHNAKLKKYAEQRAARYLKLYHEGVSMTEIARRKGISKQRVQQILSRFL